MLVATEGQVPIITASARDHRGNCSAILTVVRLEAKGKLQRENLLSENAGLLLHAHLDVLLFQFLVMVMISP